MPPVVPTATYRLQLSSKLGFDDAAALVPYLKSLGVSHLYASPFLKARAGSTHGYDIVDHDALNPEFGGDEAFDRLSEALAKADIGLILDFVPNHMGVGYADNAWWLDVLEWGQKSPHAASFDIEWETLPYRPNGGLLIPVLGKSYGEALDDGDLVLKYDAGEGSFSVWYFEHRLPIRPNRYGDILKTVVAEAGAADTDAGRKLLALANRFPDPNEPSREHAPAFKAELAAVPGGAEVIERGLAAYRPGAADPTRLHRLLERQHYRVAHWRVAFTEINYRRFFDINDLAGIKVENLATFDAAHRRVLQLVRDGRLHGLRLDHVDGLLDPVQYARRLSRVVRAVRPGPARTQPFYIVAEKILAEGEPMPAMPGIAGTTGYDVLNDIVRVLLDDAGMPRLDALYRDILGERQDFERIVEDAKLRVLDTMLASEFTVLCRLLARIAAGHWKSRDFTFERLRAALQAYIVHFPVYRTYIGAGGQVSAEDRARIVDTITRARSRWYGPDTGVLEFLQDVLTLDLIAPGRQGYSIPRVRRFSAKVQQLTGPVMAKALEDTAFYRFHRLIALNEVGGEPVLPALSPGEFDYRMKARFVHPHAMVATATHDTKRGEDARMRILSIAEIAPDWEAAVRRWRLRNEAVITKKPRRSPSDAHEYMLYQALVGVWPNAGGKGSGGADAGLVERLQTYAVKALREGKQETSWHNPNDAYEGAVTAFIARLLDPDASSDFLADFSEIAGRTALLGALNSLSQLGLKMTIPGVPDIYQGTELWDLSLVDPDNRRAVDFDARNAMLTAIGETPDWAALAASWTDGRIKLALTHRLLELRRALPAVFADGGYAPLPVEGPQAGHVLAFARTGRRDAVIVAVLRHVAPLTEGGRRWLDADGLDAAVSLDGYTVKADALRPGGPVPSGTVPAKALFGPLPVAVLRATHGARAAGRAAR
ncbi:malto-oligosyltrehalose synthase [Rhodoplanes elegans]|uniref:Malto-oligosyltrehalose synthase n=1 Tax=Rhodoplanes elegans TaxID=29408 RepID=A0A327KJL5_9BRAD|nr:malto-oligosyltrehalose synthase [Rhodoplanes elegans]MBK5958793.1 malto-oligosyltrehalose synthase [Rhodoplanes elegans]RAI38980.1 malto-oligosyltrehalose synthase [Rhodoplanes elegans]